MSLLELIVTMAIMSLLLGLSLSGVQRVRAAAARAACLSNLKQLAVAAHNYEAANRCLPPCDRTERFGTGNSNVLMWTILLLPYLDQDAIWQGVHEAYRTAPGYQHPPHIGLVSVVKTYACPADGRLASPLSDSRGFTAAYGSYQGVLGSGTFKGFGGHLQSDGAMRSHRGVGLLEFQDGQSQTLMFGERPPPGLYLFGNWYTAQVPESSWLLSKYRWGMALPIQQAQEENGCRGPFRFSPGRVENSCDSRHFWSLHPGGGHFALADGSVRFLTYSAVGTLPALATRAGGEVVEIP